MTRKIMYYFKQESNLIKQLLLFCKRAGSVVSCCLQANMGLIGFAIICLAGCNQISISRKMGHNLIKTPVANGENMAGKSSHVNGPIELSGLWKIGFRSQGKSYSGNMQIQQNNQSFSGKGQDEQSGEIFTIERGEIKDDEVVFLKRYANRPNQAVQYHGRFSYISSANGETPYMGGDFSIEVNGAVTVGDWEAAMAEIKSAMPEAKPPVVNTPNNKKDVEEEPKQTGKFDHYPDLSGKWSAAYEWNFKTVHSTMFLEQYGHKITGHGIDSSTKEKFVIKKGWYDFPHLTIIRFYPSRPSGSSLVTFKAEVSEVSDKDYTGPYLSGKTQGGGAWEAQRVN